MRNSPSPTSPAQLELNRNIFRTVLSLVIAERGKGKPDHIVDRNLTRLADLMPVIDTDKFPAPEPETRHKYPFYRLQGYINSILSSDSDEIGIDRKEGRQAQRLMHGLIYGYPETWGAPERDMLSTSDIAIKMAELTKLKANQLEAIRVPLMDALTVDNMAAAEQDIPLEGVGIPEKVLWLKIRALMLIYGSESQEELILRQAEDRARKNAWTEEGRKILAASYLNPLPRQNRIAESRENDAKTFSEIVQLLQEAPKATGRAAELRESLLHNLTTGTPEEQATYLREFTRNPWVKKAIWPFGRKTILQWKHYGSGNAKCYETTLLGDDIFNRFTPGIIIPRDKSPVREQTAADPRVEVVAAHPATKVDQISVPTTGQYGLPWEQTLPAGSDPKRAYYRLGTLQQVGIDSQTQEIICRVHPEVKGL
jgi:hypothetical protein